MRRELKFRSFKDVRNELERLQKGPVETTGSWSYFQILTHCAKGFEGSMKGVKREMPWWKKHFLGPLTLRGMWLKGSIPIGIKGPPTDRMEGDDRQAMVQLLIAIEDFEKFEGPFSDHPRVGKLDKEGWRRFHVLHLANHLGYTKPKN
jgi:hypothetical protein